MAQKVVELMERSRPSTEVLAGRPLVLAARRAGSLITRVALTVALGVVLFAGAALAQTGGGGGFDPKGMALGFAEVVGWIVLAIGIIVAAKALWNESLVRAVVAIFGAGLFCFVALNVEKLQGLGEWAWSLTGL